jgi:preprotein translocase subunit YajC
MTLASFTAAASMNAANRKQSGNKTPEPKHGIKVGDSVVTSNGKKGTVSFVDGDNIHVKGANDYYPNHITQHAANELKKKP